VIFRSPLPDVVVPALLVHQSVLRHAATQPDKAALIDGPTGRVLTYGQLDDGVRRFAAGLVAFGLAPGDVVAILAPNRPEYPVVFHGTSYAGGVVTTINPSYTSGEIRHQLTDATPRLLVTTAAFAELAERAAAGTSVEQILVFDDGAGADGPESVASFSRQPLSEPVAVDQNSPAALPYSSGTTGLSKGVVLTHRNLVANMEQVMAGSGVRIDEKVMGVLPLFHIYGMQVIMNCALARGATVITMSRFDVEQFLELHQRYAITRCYVAPPIAVALAKHPAVDRYDLSALETMNSGAAPMSAELQHEVATRLGCDVVQGYGMTELSPTSHLTPLGRVRPGSVGVTTPNAETRIVDPSDGRDLDVDQEGEVWVRGPQVMAGYLNNPEATAATLDADGWLRTGDIGRVDADGYLWIVDRLKELIKFKGFQVAPAELEALLLTHPAIADAAVIGLPDDEAGEVPVGFVVLKDGHVAEEADLLDHVARQTATFKHLHRVTFIDAVPKSPSGKILRRLLR
jgi:4-coumarate--CoA ligase